MEALEAEHGEVDGPSSEYIEQVRKAKQEIIDATELPFDLDEPTTPKRAGERILGPMHAALGEGGTTAANPPDRSAP